MDLSIAIVSYNTKDFLKECLSSIRQHPPSCDYEILVIDNASTDGSPDLVREEFPEVMLYPNPKNVGYAAAVNQAFRGSDSEFVLVLNPDIVVTRGAIDALLEYMKASPRVGIAGGKLLNPDGSLQYSCRTFYTLKTLLYRRTFLGKLFSGSTVISDHLMQDWDHENPRSVDWVIGACMMVRRSAVEDAGPADERFFLYFEDVDWCYRMKSRGWEVHYCPISVMVHHHRRDSARGFFGPGLRAHLASVFRFYEKWSLLVYVTKRHSSWTGTAGAVLGDAAAVTLAFLAAYVFRQALSFLLQKPLFPLASYASFLALIVVLALISFSYFGLYRRTYTDWADELVDVGKALSAACIIVMASTFVLYLRSFSRIVLVSFWPLSIIAVTGLRAAMRRMTTAARASGFGARRVLVLGGAELRRELETSLNVAGRERMEVVAPPELVLSDARAGDSDTPAAIVSFVDEQRITDVVIVIGEVPDKSVAGLIAPLRRRGIRVRLHTGAARVLTAKSTVEEFGDFGLIAMEESVPCPAGSVSKRAMDLAISIPGILVIGLYELARWALRRPTVAGSARARRSFVGKGGRTFVADFHAGENGEVRAGARTRLQLLYNVLRGRLSLVGPKPLTEEAWSEAGVSWKGVRSNLVPGLFGTWNLDGAGGEDPKRLEAMDLQYLREWSLGLDLKIIVKALAGRGTPVYLGMKS